MTMPPATRIVLKRGAPPRHLPTLASVAVLAAAGVLLCTQALAQSALRTSIPLILRPPSNAVWTNTRPQVGRFDTATTSGTPGDSVISGRTVQTITQLDASGILRVGSADIGANATVKVDQPSSTAILLVKPDGGYFQSQNMTVIDGFLNSNGQIYIYNPNGIIFGKTSQVNVNSLIGTTLKIDETRFLTGLMTPSTVPIFSADPTRKDADGKLIVPGSVTVEGDSTSQGQITAANGGKILLIAPKVVNNGILSAADGQVVLAAGRSVYLASPSDTSMRGLLVEVSNANGEGSTVENGMLGKVLVGRGNATLVGLAVNQLGTVSATTSVSSNGSIYLLARDGASKSDPNLKAVATNGGQLTIGENSVTSVTPTLDDTSTIPTASASTTFKSSKIELSGKTIHVKQGATIEAKGGTINIAARAKPSNVEVSPNGDARLYLEAGSRIDASGTTSEMAMESNVIAVELRGSELADSPLQRNSVLRGRTVMVDIRKGTPLADISGYLGQVGKNVGQLTAAGGSVSLTSDGDVIVNRGATIDVSGGQVNYRAGHVATSQLTSFGRTTDIGSASASVPYDGLINAVAGARNFEAAYSQGSSAGTVYLNASTLVMRGNLKGTVTPGAKQRDVKSADFPLGGQIVFGNKDQFSYSGTVNLGGTATKDITAPAFDESWDKDNAGHTVLKSTLDVDTAALSEGGFNRINVYTQGPIIVSKPVDLAAGGEVRLATLSNIEFDAGVKTPGGKIEAVSAKGRLTVAPGSVFDTAGLWTNDSTLTPVARDAQGNPTTPIITSGGTITLQGQIVDIGAGSRFDASGGAWQNSSGKISGGSGGSISIVSTPTSTIEPQSAQLTLGKGTEFSAYGLTSGGTLKLTGRNVTLGAAAADPLLDLGFTQSFFERGGFAKYDITAQGNLKVVADAVIHPTMKNWTAIKNTATSASGRMSDAFAVSTLPLSGLQGTRGASSLSLAAASEATSGDGQLWLQQGAKIVTDPGATVTLKAGRQLTVDGEVTAKGGNIIAFLSQTMSEAEATMYRPERSIWFGAHSLLDVGGSADRLWTDNRGFTQGEVLDGGKIQIGGINTENQFISARGYVVAENGSRFNVAGISAPMTLSSGRLGTVTRSVASAGGAIDIRAAEGLLFDGSFTAKGGDSSVAGGSLSVSLDHGTPATGYPDAARELTVLRVKPNAGTATEGIVPSGLEANQAITGYEGKGYLLADTLTQGGFDRITLKSQDVLAFDAGGTSLALNTRGALTLDAPLLRAQNLALGGSISLSSDYVRIGNSNWLYQGSAKPAQATGANATLAVNAGTIDLIGKSVLQGIGHTKFKATGDIRLIGQVDIDLATTPSATDPAIHAKGSFTAAGEMSFTARQIYPTTMSEFTLNANGGDSRIEFHRNGSIPASPLSAAGTLTVNAHSILQDGVVRAPFGSITLAAVDTLTYTANSLTSVTGSGSVPFGRVNNGREWVYDFGNGHTVAINSTASNGITLPQKTIVSQGKSVTVEKGATIDLSGGGDLYAYEFVAGPGGSKDVLARASGATASTVFAVMPGYADSVAPVDFQYQQDGSLQVGDRIYLSGIPGLAAGFYTLLPAHYALLSGAFAVTAVSGSRDMLAAANYVKPDGTWVVAGYRGSSVAKDSRWTGYELTSSSQVRTRSEFTDYAASTAFSTSSFLPRDGGHLVFAASETLTLDGLFKLGALTGGRRGIADISATDIVVVADDSQDTGTAVKLKSSDLVALGADSLLLGGVRDYKSDGVHVTVNAQNVTLANNAAHPLTGPEVILAAKNTVKVVEKSVLASNGTPSSSGGDLIITGSGDSANGALLRVSGGAQVAVVRNSPTATATTGTGTLSIDAGTTISAAGSMNLDATKLLDNKAKLDLGKKAALSLGANRISFGQAVPGIVDGLRFDTAALTALSALDALSLTSYSTFDIYGAASLGSSATRTLSLRGAGMQSYGTSGTVTLTADTVRFDGGGTFTPAVGQTVADGSAGNLTVAATDIEIGSKGFAVKGFKEVNLTAQREVRAVGTGGNFSAEKAMTVAAGRITTLTGADASLQAGNKLTLTNVAKPLAPVTTDALAGKLTFIGQSVESDATIVAKSGQIKLQATGDEGVNITGGEINASGYSKAFGTTVAYAPAGSIVLDGGNGNVIVSGDHLDADGKLVKAAVLDVSAVGADAGLISVTATNGKNGTAALNGTLKGSAGAGVDGKTPNHGRFALDVDSVGSSTQFTALNDKLNAGEFTESRSVRVRHGNITVDNKGTGIDAIKAYQVVLAADDGNITIGGQINATGSKGGSIELYASKAAAPTFGKGKVTLLSTAVLDASSNLKPEDVTTAAGSAGDGGRIVISTATKGRAPYSVNGDASINIANGALLKVNGVGSGQGGSVLLRAPRVRNNNVAVSTTDSSTLGNAVQGASDFAIEAYKVYSTTGNATIGAKATDTYQVATSTGVPAGTLYSEADTYINAAKGNIQSRLGTTAKLRAGIEVQTTGNLTVSVNETASNPQDRGWNLNAWRFGGDETGAGAEAGVLTLRAAGNLTINGSISDGFTKPTTKVSMPGWLLDTNANTNASSWSYRIAAGSDFAAANPLAVNASTTVGDVKLDFARKTGGTNDQPVALLRTGTGRIDIAAGHDIVLGSTTSSATLYGAQIYTAGRAGTPEITAPKNAPNKAFTTSTTTTAAAFGNSGGDISLYANNDITGAATLQQINNWLFRQGRINANGINTNTAWWSRYDYFNEGVATFGGGDISVVAATGNVKDLSVSTATNAWVTDTGKSTAKLVEQGGGDLKVIAGDDILGGTYYVQKGKATLDAGGSIGASSRTVYDPSVGANVALRPVLALGDASIELTASKDIQIETAFNPTLTPQSTSNAASATAPQYSAFSTYSSNSSVNLTSKTGNVLLSNNSRAMLAASGSVLSPTSTDLFARLYQNYPGNLQVTAFDGDISYEHGFTLWASPTGSLGLLAGGSVRSTFLPTGWAQSVVMLDIDPAQLPNIYAPYKISAGPGSDDPIFDVLTGGGVAGHDGLSYHASNGLHSNDPEPVRIVALDGDISGDVNMPYTFILPKRAEILAGRDIKNLGFKIQHLGTDDVTRIEAGRDFIDSTGTAQIAVTHQVSGPGRVDIQTGRDFDLGTGHGLVTRGNLDNPNLPDQGASINVVAGAHADYANFFRQFVALADLSAADQAALTAYVRAIDPSLPAGIDGATALQRFNALPASDQTAFLSARKSMLNDLFFVKVRLASQGPNGGVAADLTRFDALIASLYPTSSITGGDINVFGSQLKTESGGAISLFAPGGSIFAGLAQPPVWLSDLLKGSPGEAANFGIMSIRGGAIQALVKNDFSVNQGRVFTLGGGDITLVSQYGNIDAGKGTKTAVSAPPPLIKTDKYGNTVVDVSASVAGSGIATLRTNPRVLPSNVYPVAPRGIFDAGDAGVRSSGSVTIIAALVLNAGNIMASGGVSGAPAANTSGLGSMSAPTNTGTARADDITKSMETSSGNAGGTLNVEVIGFGDQQVVTQTGNNSPTESTEVCGDEENNKCKKKQK